MISACISVDLPDPVRPAIKTCCDVPCPSVKCCRLVAPALPSGTSTPDRLSRVHQAPSCGRDEFKRNLDALGVLGGGADFLNLPRGEISGGGESSVSG